MKTNQSKILLAVFLTVLMVTPGCTQLFDDSIDDGIQIPTFLGDGIFRNMGQPDLQTFDDCEQLEQSLKSSIEEEMRTSLLQAIDEVYFWGWGLEDDIVMADGSAESSNSGSSPPTRTQGTDFSGTNNQEQGVDEADFVKTDGYHIFFLDSGQLHIFDVPEFGEITHKTSIEIEGNPVAMLLEDDKLVVISTVSSWNINSEDPLAEAMGWDGDWYGWRTSTLTKFTVFDIEAEKGAAWPLRELYIEGYYLTAREVEGTVRAVTHTWIDIPGVKTWLDLPDNYWELDWEDPKRKELRIEAAAEAISSNQEVLSKISLAEILPQVHERVNDEIITHHMSEGDCEDFAAPENSWNRGFTSIFTLDMLHDTAMAFEADHIVGNWPLVYASEDMLIITESAWDWWWFWDNNELNEMTNIHTFDISEPGSTDYIASSRIAGTIESQFSISEHEGFIRVATTTGQWGRWWIEEPDPLESHVVVLDFDLEKDPLFPQTTMQKTVLTEVGSVSGIAYNETIWSTRFVGDRAYIVTFENMDPLWTIDLSDPTNPQIMGELEVPGVSTYIHPLSDDAILTIGLGPADEETGLGLDWGHTRLSLFNVSNFSDPQLTQTLSLSAVDDPHDGWTWAWSEATWEHKAFQYWEPKGMLAVPLNTYRHNYWYVDGEYHWEYEWVSKLIIVNVTENGLSIHGEVNHSEFYESNENSWWSSYNIRRSIFMGDYIYAISHAGITATHLETLEEVASVQIYNEDETSTNSDTEEASKETEE
ncbi:MAG: beta-propeller domain-containing protein [Candidatus Poseidoniaceae archaeon]|jgi:uncharacterized secreted protein with C-terminal beta-propeller domain|nr:beta-propeller domain-containing protein [Candidatus Poseidoniaceae archaeon]